MIRSVKLFIFTGLFFLALSLLFLPKVISTTKGREWVFSAINHYIPGKISAANVNLNWFSGQEIEQFSLDDECGKEILHFDRFKTDETLFFLLFRRFKLGETELINPRLELTETNEGETNLRRALGLKKKKREEKKPRKIPKFKGHIVVSNGEMTITPEKLYPIALSSINFEAKDSCFFQFSAKTKQGPELGDIVATGEICEQLHITATIHKFPVILIDQFLEGNLYESALGTYLDLDFELEEKEDTLILKSKISSPNLNGNVTGLTSNGEFHVDQGEIVFTVTPLFFKNLFQTKTWELANRPELHLSIDKFVFPLKLKKPDLRSLPFKGKLSLERLEMTHEKIGSFSLNDLQANLVSLENLDIDYTAQIKGKGEATNVNGKFTLFKDNSVAFNTSVKALPTDVLELVMSADYPYLHKILGDQFSFSIDGIYNKRIKAQLVLNTAKFELAGPIEGPNLQDLKAEMKGFWIIPKKNEPYLGSNLHLTLDANLSFYERNFVIPQLNLEAENANLKIEAAGNIGEKGKCFDYNDTNLVITGKLIHGPFYHDSLDYKGSFTVEFEGRKNQILGKANLATSPFGEQSASVTFTAKDVIVDNELKLDQSDIYLSGKVNNFPLQLVDQVFDYKVKLYPLLGPALDLDTIIHYSPKKEHLALINLEAKAQGFFTQAAIILNEKLEIQENKPLLLHWELDQTRYNYLLQLVNETPSEFVLEGRGEIDVILDKIHCPKVPKENFLCEAGFTGTMNVSPLHFYNPKTKEKLRINNFKGNITSENFAKAITFNVSSTIDTDAENQKSGLSGKVETLNLFTSAGKFNKEGLTIKGDLNFDLLPVKAVTGILPIKPDNRTRIAALLGELVNAHIYGEIAKLSGPVTIDIKSSNFNGLFPLFFTKDSLLLTKTVEADLRLTEEINHVLLKDVTPILITGAWSDHPIRIKIDANGFYMHLRPFSLQGVYIENGMIDLGRLRVRNGGEILSLAKFLKAQAVTPEGVMEAWFTPIYFSLKEGVASYRRFDALLAGNIHIALWGNIDIGRDLVRMTLGISSDTLRQSLNLQGLPSSEMFQVKMMGTTSKLDLDWSAASARIAILVTRSTAGPIGAIVGGVLEQLIGVGGETTPPPTTFPYPWQ